MMKAEFEKLTGHYPGIREYHEIEKRYMDMDVDKQEFCRRWKENEEGLQEKIQSAIDSAWYKEFTEREKEAESLKKQIEDLKVHLDRELQWEPYEDPHNVQEDIYQNLLHAGGTRILDDREAKELLADEFGFAPERIRIIREVSKFEVNRHRQCRRNGVYSREPLYNATDWNYIRFDCGIMTWEVYNDELRPFYH